MERYHYLVTHDDLDGAGCEIVFRKFCDAYGIKYQVCHANYSTVDNIVTNLFNYNDDVASLTIADISVSPETVKIVDSKKGDRVIKLLDHHATAKVALADCSWAMFAEGNVKCGSDMLYEYLQKFFCPVPYSAGTKEYNYFLDLNKFVTFVSAYDRWQTDSEAFKLGTELDRYLSMVGMEMFVEYMMSEVSLTYTLKDGSDHVCINEDISRLIDSYYKNGIDNLRQKVKHTMIAVEKIGVVKIAYVYSDIFINELAQRMRDDGENDDLLAVIDMNNMLVSLRSIKEDICDVIALQYGGGGHNVSAGFSFNSFMEDDVDKNRNDIVDIVFRKK